MSENEEIEKLQYLIDKLKDIRLTHEKETNFFDVGGNGYLENPTSDLMALFMGGGEGSSPCWLAKALVACLVGDDAASSLDWENICVQREVSDDDSNKRIDIVLWVDGHLIGVENKVRASLYNPLSEYAKILNSLAKKEEEQIPPEKIHKCILASNTVNASEGWKLISYECLVEKATKLYGQEILKYPYSKWHPFYQEFLAHLKNLNSSNGGVIMVEENMQFVMSNYQQLLKAGDVISQFEKQMVLDLKELVANTLSVGMDDIETRQINWKVEGSIHKTIQLFPRLWGGKNYDNKIVLVYLINEENNGQICFYVRAYFDGRKTPISIAEIKSKLIQDKEEGIFDKMFEYNEFDCQEEGGGKYLYFDFDFYDDKSKAFDALTKMTQWVHKIHCPT